MLDGLVLPLPTRYLLINYPFKVSSIKSIVSSKDNTHFYLLMSSKNGLKQGNWHLKRVSSVSGSKKDVSLALRKPITVKNQTTVLWSADDMTGSLNSQASTA